MALPFLDWLPVGLKTYYSDMKGCVFSHCSHAALHAQVRLLPLPGYEHWCHLEPVSEHSCNMQPIVRFWLLCVITGRNNTPVSVVCVKMTNNLQMTKITSSVPSNNLGGGGALWQPAASDGLGHPEASQDVLVSPLGSSQIGHLSIQSVVRTYMDVNCSLTVAAAGRNFPSFMRCPYL